MYKRILIAILLCICGLVAPINSVFADCNDAKFTVKKSDGTSISPFAIPNNIGITLSFDISGVKPPDYVTNNGYFEIQVEGEGQGKNLQPSNNVIARTFSNGFTAGKTKTITLRYHPNGQNDRILCTDSITISDTESGACSVVVSPRQPAVTENITANVTLKSSGTFVLMYNPPGGRPREPIGSDMTYSSTGKNTYAIKLTNYGVSDKPYEVYISPKSSLLHLEKICTTSFGVTTEGGAQLESQFSDLCSYATGEAKTDCMTCTNETKGIWTAIGCIPATLDGFVKTILPFAIGLAGGIAFVLMLFGALQIMMSAGNPEKLNAGKELLSSAIVGLLLIIFSVFILKAIGVTILGIPGFK